MKSILAILAAVCLLLVTGCDVKGPPLVEQTTSSLWIRVGDTASVTAYAVDFDRDSVSLRFSWGDGETSGWSRFVASRDTVSMVHSWAGPGRMLVKTQARDRQGHLSDWLGGVRVSVFDSALVKWMVWLDDGVRECPAIGPDGTVYVSGSHSLSAVGPDGMIKWRYSDLYFPCSPVVGTDGTIYVVDEVLRALNQDGSLRWTDTLDWYTQRPPAVGADGTIYFGTRDLAVALNPDGSVRWQAGIPGYAVSSPAITTDGRILLPVYGGRVCAFGADGESLFTVQLDGAQCVIAGPSGSFYVASDFLLSAFGQDGTRQWTHRLHGRLANSPALARDGNILIPTDSTERLWPGLDVLTPSGDSASGWYFNGEALPTAPAAVASGHVAIGGYVARDGFGEFAFIDSAFETRWAIGLGGAAVTSATIAPDGTIYIGAGSNAGYLYALRGTAGLAASPWPKYQHDERNSGCAAAGR